MKKFEKTAFFMDKIYCYERDIKNIIFSVFGVEETAEDITQNVLEKAWKGLDTLENREDPLPWIKGIVRNEIRKYIRAKKKNRENIEDNAHIELISDSCIKCYESDILLGLLEKDRRVYVLKALDMLDYKSRQIVALHLIIELSLKQIAESLNLNYGSTRVIYSRAIKKLRKLYFELENGVKR